MKIYSNSVKRIISVYILFILLLHSGNVNATTFYSILSGNWNSSSNWSLSSGGPPGTNIPSITDSVIIEAGISITVSNTSSCLNLRIGNNGSGSLLFNSNQTLTVSNSVLLNGGSSLNMVNGGNLIIGGDFATYGSFNSGIGTLILNGHSPQTLNYTSGTINLKNLSIDNSAGVNLLGNMGISGSLSLINGTLQIENGKTLYLYNGVSANRVNGKLNIENGTISSQMHTYNGIIFPYGFFQSKIGFLIIASATSHIGFALNDEIICGGMSIYGPIYADKFILLGDGLLPSGSIGSIGWANSTSSTLTIGNGTTKNQTIDPALLTCPNLVVNCGAGTASIGFSHRQGVNCTISKSINLLSGKLELTNNLGTLIFSGNSLTRNTGIIKTTSLSYDRGIFSFNNNAVLNTTGILPQGVFEADTITNLSINGNAGIELGANLAIKGRLSLIKGILNVGEKTLSYSGNSIQRNPTGFINCKNGTLMFLNATPINTTGKLPSDMFLSDTIKILRCNGAGGFLLGSDLSISGKIYLTKGTVSIDTFELNFFGDSIIQKNGLLVFINGTTQFSNSGNISIPTVLMGNGFKNLTINSGGTISGVLIVTGQIILKKGILGGILTYSGNSIIQNGNGYFDSRIDFYFKNKVPLTISTSVFKDRQVNRLNMEGEGGITLNGNLTINTVFNLVKGELSIGDDTLILKSGFQPSVVDTGFINSISGPNGTGTLVIDRNNYRFEFGPKNFKDSTLNNLIIKNGVFSIGYNHVKTPTSWKAVPGSITIRGNLSLMNGLVEVHDNTLIYSGTSGKSISRQNGVINTFLDNYMPPINRNGKIIFANSSSITLPSNLFDGNKVKNMEINSTSSVTTSNLDTLSILGNLTISKGTLNLGNFSTLASGKTLIVGSEGVLNTNNFLKLKGNSTTPANIGTSGGTINGKVEVELSIPGGKRGDRIISHPFTALNSNTIPLNSLIDDIYITGPGGTSNGFDSSITNFPTANYFSEADYKFGTNTGWIQYGKTSDLVPKYSGLKILYRGPRSQGSSVLSDSTILPLAGNLNWSGEVNQGDVNVPLTYTTSGTPLIGGIGFGIPLPNTTLDSLNSGWNLIGNPYPSNIELGNIPSARRKNLSTFYVWNPNNGIGGSYETKSFGSSYILPSGAAFFVKTDSAGYFQFLETDKTTLQSASLFKTSTQEKNAIELSLYSNLNSQDDKLLIKQQEGSVGILDAFDGVKLKNPTSNLFSLSENNAKLSIDCRNEFPVGSFINLGIQSNLPLTYTLKTNYITLADKEVFLVDNLLHTYTKLVEGNKYKFETSVEPNSFGERRFSLEFRKTQSPLSTHVTLENTVSVFPNPARNNLQIELSKSKIESITYHISSIDGRECLTGELAFENTNQRTINLESLNSGIYILTFEVFGQLKQVKIIKE